MKWLHDYLKCFFKTFSSLCKRLQFMATPFVKNSKTIHFSQCSFWLFRIFLDFCLLCNIEYKVLHASLCYKNFWKGHPLNYLLPTYIKKIKKVLPSHAKKHSSISKNALLDPIGLYIPFERTRQASQRSGPENLKKSRTRLKKTCEIK